MTFNKGRALVIGISNYDEAALLPEAVLNDARDIVSVLNSTDYCGFLPGNVKVLLDEKATLDAIRAELAELASSGSPDDTVIIFFSGHGAQIGSGAARTSALIPVDFQTDNVRGTVLEEAEFSAALAAMKASKLLVFIDSCYSGGAGVLKVDEDNGVRLGFDEKSLHRLAQGAGRVIIASSRASETSLVMAGARNSIFTEHLLEALKGKARTTGDGLIRVFDVFNYVSEQVRGAVPGRQHPIFKASDLEDNFPVALDRGGTKAPSAVQPSAPAPWREVEGIIADLYPAGPIDQEIWARAGGDVSRLKLSGTGRANWFAALRTLRLGGGGQNISYRTLLSAAIEDFPHHPELAALMASAQ
ncbi:caspase family protein [Micromonospora sp. NPDC048839]|uniref:caspase family protein n=1 Tax=Micromonospora sp. NPDC048839 TaxID=3155641 RepID=UPI0033E63788